MKIAATKNPADKETHYEAMARLGLIGCIKGGPSDVARNHRKYLRRALRSKYAR
ncbi:MAG: hypothetical protein HY017_10510 [Betaproteobacteria bacterium]|nr:hypothetical protein [Betaproteobacteria bacterium]